MARVSLRSVRLPLLGAVAFVGSSTDGAAQYLPFRPGFYFTNPATGQQFNYNFGYNTAYSYSFMNPVTGVMNTTRYQYSFSGLPPFGFYPPAYGYPAYNPGYVSPYMSYGGYSSNSAANPFVRNQLRMFNNAPAQNQGGGAGDEKPGDPPRADLRNKPAPTAMPAGLDRALTEPADDAILSGKVLNDLSAAIRALERAGAKADSPLLPAELVTHINYAGGPAAGALAALRGGKPTAPAAIAGADFAALRADLDRAVTPVADPLLAGNKPDAAAADRLAAAVKRARETLTPTLAALPRAEADTVSQYLSTLDGLARAGKDVDAAGLFPRRWASTGATVSEVLRQMDKSKVTFAAASPGDEDVYYSLHRGLVGYYAGLTQAKR